MRLLEAEGIIVSRGGRAIVDRVSLTLRPGMFVALLGANGAGKSTLLAVLAGLLAADEGLVTLGGAALARLDRRALARARAFLPQNARAEWPISVERLVALGLTPQLPAFGGLPASLRHEVDRVLEACDLVSQRGQAATTLSGGELARAMLARATVGDPDLLIADEPLAGLDPRHALESVTRLRSIADEGRLVIASIHELTLCARHATHLAVMRNGCLAAFGTIAETMTSAMVSDVFDVDACVTGAGRPGATVDFVGTPRRHQSADPSST